jgi:hypothetical protein
MGEMITGFPAFRLCGLHVYNPGIQAPVKRSPFCHILAISNRVTNPITCANKFLVLTGKSYERIHLDQSTTTNSVKPDSN